MSFQRLICPLLTSAIVAISGSDAAQAAPDERNEIQLFLRKAQSAAQKLNYSGTFVYQQSSQIRTSKISHVYDGSGETEKLEILDGKPREYIRRNDEVSCYLPDSKVIQVEKNVTQEVFPALFGSNASHLTDSYLIKKTDQGRVAGVECQTYLFEPRDAYRYGYRVCADKNSGLLLRAQTVNSKNEVIEQIAFTQILTGDIDKALIKPSFLHTSQWQVENLTVQSNMTSGWVVNALPAGFRKTREMKRVIPVGNEAPGGKPHQVIQMIFSDGMAAFSVFIEPDTGQRSEGSLQQGAMTIMGKKYGDYWLTVVGEVPFAAIKQVMNSIDFKPK